MNFFFRIIVFRLTIYFQHYIQKWKFQIVHIFVLTVFELLYAACCLLSCQDKFKDRHSLLIFTKTLIQYLPSYPNIKKSNK